MTNNDILRRIRYTFDFGDSKMMAIFGLADLTVTRAQVSDWLKKKMTRHSVNSATSSWQHSSMD